MAEIKIDPDIAAASETQLEAIMAQQQRNESEAREKRAQERHAAEMAALTAREARAVAHAAREERRVAAFEADVKRLQGLHQPNLREQLAVAIAPKYFTTGTGQGATAQADAIADAGRFEFALDEACKVLDKPYPTDAV